MASADGNEIRVLTEADLDQAWELERELLEQFRQKTTLYLEFYRRFSCNEAARYAEYDGKGQVSSED